MARHSEGRDPEIERVCSKRKKLDVLLKQASVVVIQASFGRGIRG